MKTVLVYLKPYIGRMSVQFIIKLTGTVMDLLLPWLLSYIIDDVAPTGDRVAVLWVGGGMALAAAIAVVTNVVANRMACGISRQATERLRRDLFRRTARLSCRQTDAFTVPSLISRLTSDTYNVHSMWDRIQRLGVRAPILLIGGMLVTLTLEPVLTLLLAAVLPLLALTVYVLSRKGIPLYAGVQTALDALTRKVRETMGGVRVIKALSREGAECDRFDALNETQRTRERRAGTVMALSNPLMNLLLNVGLTLVVVVGAFRVNGGLTQPGKIIAFLSYFTIILNAMLMITRMFVILSRGTASARRVAEILDAPDECGVVNLPEAANATEAANAPEAPPEAADATEAANAPEASEAPPETPEAPPEAATPKKNPPPHIAFRHVTFSYNKRQNNVEDVSFTLEHGQTLGIIGETGSGKSTLLFLLMRMYDADAGTVELDGQDVRTLPPESLHTRFGVVFQNDFVMSDSLYANVDFLRGVSEQDALWALDTAQAGFARLKDGGLSYALGVRGANLSGGQRQRVLIARALAAKPEILVLDDAASALDYRTEAALRGALRRELPDVTTVIVAQRVSSILRADHILVLSDGRVIGQGTHETLLRDCASYREIYEAQMGGAA